MNRKAPAFKWAKTLSAFAILFCMPQVGRAGAGTEGASFLEIPVGGRPAALAGAYSALATDAYAPVWNPAGLGFLKDIELATTHLSYLDGIGYEFIGLAGQLSPGRSLGASVQYLHTGTLQGLDASGNPASEFTVSYGAYSLAYGQTLGDDLSLGVTGKFISGQIDGSSAHAWTADLGAMYRLTERWTLAGVVGELGTNLTFVSQPDPLPRGARLAVAYQPTKELVFSLEGQAPTNSSPSMSAGGEWRVMDVVALRAGYQTSTIQQNSPMAGVATGVGIRVWGQDFDYAWVPFGDLGTTQYFSLVIRFGAFSRSQAAADAPKQEEMTRYYQ
jgi:hypothetical protein